MVRGQNGNSSLWESDGVLGVLGTRTHFLDKEGQEVRLGVTGRIARVVIPGTRGNEGTDYSL